MIPSMEKMIKDFARTHLIILDRSAELRPDYIQKRDGLVEFITKIVEDPRHKGIGFRLADVLINRLEWDGSKWVESTTKQPLVLPPIQPNKE